MCRYDDSLAKVCADLCQKWCEWDSSGCPEPTPFTYQDITTISAGQIQEFLAELLIAEPLSVKAIQKMQLLYKFDDSKNCEILFRYYVHLLPKKALKRVTSQLVC